MRCSSICRFWVLGWDYVSQLPYVWYYVGVKSSFQHAREECESKRAMCFRCLMFSETIRNVFAILLLNVMEVCLVWVKVHCWIDHVRSSKECVVPVIRLCI